jgi:hypothetical protein
MPTIRASTAPTATTSPTSPGSTAIGDLVIVIHWTPGTAGEPTHTIQSGNNFVEIRTHAHNDGSTDGRLSVAYKIATAGGANAYNAYTSSGGTSDFAGIVVLQVGTWEQSNVLQIGDVQASSTLTTNAVPNPASVVTPRPQCLVLAIGAWHMGAGATVTITEPSGYLETWEVAGSAASELSCASKTVATATTEDPGAFTDDVTPNGSVSMTLVFRPRAIALAGDVATFALTGIATGLTAQRTIGAAVGTFTETGTATGLLRGYPLVAATGSFVLTGNDVALDYEESTGVTLDADVGAFAVTGNAAGLTAHRALTADAGVFAVTGNATGLTAQRTLGADTATFVFSGQAASLSHAHTITAAVGTFTAAGQSAGLTAQRRLECAAGAFVLTGNNAGLGVSGRAEIEADVGAFALTGSAATLTVARRLAADAETFALVGSDATLTRSYILAAAAGSFVLRGRAVVFHKTWYRESLYAVETVRTHSAGTVRVHDVEVVTTHDVPTVPRRWR